MDRNKIAVDLFDKYAALYASKYMNVELYAPDLDLFCENLPEHPTVLELACGPGNITSYLHNKRTDMEIFATDLAPAMISVARDNVPSAKFGLLDCRNIKSLDSTYDAIVFAFGIPYLSAEEVEKFVSDSTTVLKSNGLLYISFMAGKYSDSGWNTGSQGDKIYLYYHDEEQIRRLLEANGYEVIHLRNIPSMMNGVPVNDVVAVARLH